MKNKPVGQFFFDILFGRRKLVLDRFRTNFILPKFNKF